MPTPPAPAGFPGLPAYAELHCRSNFSFQIGASHAEELVARAHALGYSALAITDECSVAGLVRAHAEAKKLGLKLLAGSEFVLDGGDGRFRLIALAHNLNGWGALCEFITAGRRAAPKGEYRLGWQDVTADRLPDCELILAPDRLTRSAITLEALCDRLTLGRRQFGPHFWLAAELLHGLDDDLWLTQLEQASARTGVPLVAAGDVVMHVRSRKVLHDVLTAVRLGTPVAQCGFGLQPNAEAHLRPRLRLAALYPPELLAHTTVVAARCTFSLDELRYQYPMETVLPGTTPAQTLRHHTEEGAHVRYPAGVPASRAEADRARTGADRRAAVRDVLPHRARPGALCAQPRHPVPGARLGGQLGGLLLPGRDRGGPRAHERAVRALHLARAQRAARHRRRFRAPAARGGHPVHLRQVRPRTRRADRRGHLLAHAQRAARRGPRAGHRPGADRRAGQGALLVRRQRRRGPARARRRPGPRRPARACSGWRPPRSSSLFRAT
jgi:hypothetical protein